MAGNNLQGTSASDSRILGGQPAGGFANNFEFSVNGLVLFLIRLEIGPGYGIGESCHCPDCLQDIRQMGVIPPYKSGWPW